MPAENSMTNGKCISVFRAPPESKDKTDTLQRAFNKTYCKERPKKLTKNPCAHPRNNNLTSCHWRKCPPGCLCTSRLRECTKKLPVLNQLRLYADDRHSQMLISAKPCTRFSHVPRCTSPVVYHQTPRLRNDLKALGFRCVLCNEMHRGKDSRPPRAGASENSALHRAAISAIPMPMSTSV